LSSEEKGNSEEKTSIRENLTICTKEGSSNVGSGLVLPLSFVIPDTIFLREFTRDLSPVYGKKKS